MKGVKLLILVSCSQALNIALNKPSIQSTTFSSYSSNFAVNGYRTTSISDDGCAHTKDTSEQNWWAVDLQHIYNVRHIEILGMSCCADTVSNFDVEVIMETCVCDTWDNLDEGIVTRCSYHGTGTSNVNISCPPYTIGRFIRIKRRDHMNIVLCEVEVEGDLVYESIVTKKHSYHSCGLIDTGYSGVAIDTATTRSDIHCTSMCVMKAGCCAAEYVRSTNNCTLRGSKLNEGPYYESDENKEVFFIV